jgi:hypothetical protein
VILWEGKLVGLLFYRRAAAFSGIQPGFGNSGPHWVYAVNYWPRLQQLMLKRDDRLAGWTAEVAIV